MMKKQPCSEINAFKNSDPVLVEEFIFTVLSARSKSLRALQIFRALFYLIAYENTCLNLQPTRSMSRISFCQNIVNTFIARGNICISEILYKYAVTAESQS